MDFDKAVGFEFAEAFEAGVEALTLEVGGLPVGAELAHDVQDVAAQDLVIFRQEVALDEREAASLYFRCPFFHLFFILRKSIPGIADGRGAEGDAKPRLAGGIAHEIPVQRPVFHRDQELVLRQCEVVHADFGVAALVQQAAAQFVERPFCFACRQIGLGIGPLAGLQPRHVGVAVKRQALRPQLADFLHVALDMRWRLERQPEDEVVVDAGEADFTGGLRHAEHLFLRLKAVDDPQYFIVKILHAEAEAAEAEAVQRAQVFCRGIGRVCLEAVVVVFGNRCASVDAVEQFF